jgi:hypothetical protein
MSGNITIGLTTVVNRIEELVSSDLDGETVLMSVQNGKYYGLDAIGSRIWALIEKPQSVVDICEILLKEFDVSQEQCERDVLEFVNKLAEDSLVKVVDEEVK